MNELIDKKLAHEWESQKKELDKMYDKKLEEILSHGWNPKRKSGEDVQ